MPLKVLTRKSAGAICRSRGRIALALMVACLILLPNAAALAQARGGAPIEQMFAASLAALPSEPLTTSGSVYVPAYSSVWLSQGKARADFSVTVSIHNASENRPLVIKRIAYFDGAGKLVESYLKAPVALKPFATIEAFVPTLDTRGGTGANFIIDWAAAGEIAEPVIEALMIGTFANGHYAFISQGRPIRTVGRGAAGN